MEILYSIKATILRSGTGRELKRKTSAIEPERNGSAIQNGTVSHGRANPAGIPYLYLGSEPGTAAAEVRPHPGEIVCVAEFQTESELQLVDLRKPRSLISPFLLSDESALAKLRSGDIKFLENLGQGLEVPVIPTAAAIDYTASQYLCEFIKKCGYQGVIYNSSVSKGMNLALFDPDKATVVGETTEHEITEVSVGMNPFSR